MLVVVNNNTTKCWLPPPAGHSCAPNRFWPFKLQHSWWDWDATCRAAAAQTLLKLLFCCCSALHLLVSTVLTLQLWIVR